MKHFLNILLIFILLSSCKKDTPTQGSGTPPIIAPSGNPFFKGTINGELVELSTGTDDNGFAWDSYPGETEDEAYLGYAALFGNSDISSPGKGIGILAGHFQHVYSTYNAAIFQSTMASLPATFSVEGSNNPGLGFVYTDGNTNFWSSRIGDQTGSTIVITSNQPAGNKYGLARRLISGVVNCKLYNIFSGESVNLTNGIFKCYVFQQSE